MLQHPDKSPFKIHKHTPFEIELATIIYWDEAFVKVTYTLEVQQ